MRTFAKKINRLKMNHFSLKEISNLQEMLPNLPIVQQLYPSFTAEQYESLLQKMLPHNYFQLVVFEGETPVGLTGFWLGHKLWCEKYLEIDNLIVHPDHRSKGIGKLIVDYLTEKAKNEGCSMLALDSYTDNFPAHKFFYNEGFVPRGFHFIKKLS
jgi:GNAT superfamily N-acetyltransferase